jgi:enoyl-CoA hydratase/carnithine racemase
MIQPRYGDVSIELTEHVATAEIHRPPHNFFDDVLIENLADALDALAQEPECRAVVLATEGKSFCAGADFSRSSEGLDEISSGAVARLYHQAVRVFGFPKPIVAAIQGAAVGGGLGLALVADFRVAAPEARFWANFAKLGIHPGFGLTHTLPRLIGIQRASLMFYTGRRVSGEEALAWGLADVLAPAGGLREAAGKLAAEIAACAPLAVESVRAVLRQGLAEAVLATTEGELAEQQRLAQTEDHREGVRAVAERRAGVFRRG